MSWPRAQRGDNHNTTGAHYDYSQRCPKKIQSQKWCNVVPEYLRKAFTEYWQQKKLSWFDYVQRYDYGSQRRPLELRGFAIYSLGSGHVSDFMYSNIRE